jgi:hypothetical protein
MQDRISCHHKHLDMFWPPEPQSNMFYKQTDMVSRHEGDHSPHILRFFKREVGYHSIDELIPKVQSEVHSKNRKA